MSTFNPFISKMFFLVILPGIFFLEGCECVSLGSKESLDAQEKKPWSHDECSVAGAEKVHKSYKKITPHIGINVPLDEPSKIETFAKKKAIFKEIHPEVKTLVNKKTKSIEVISSKTDIFN